MVSRAYRNLTKWPGTRANRGNVLRHWGVQGEVPCRGARCPRSLSLFSKRPQARQNHDEWMSGKQRVSPLATWKKAHGYGIVERARHPVDHAFLAKTIVFVPSCMGRLWSGQCPTLSFAHPYFLLVFVDIQMIRNETKERSSHASFRSHRIHHSPQRFAPPSHQRRWFPAGKTGLCSKFGRACSSCQACLAPTSSHGGCRWWRG